MILLFILLEMRVTTELSPSSYAVNAKSLTRAPSSCLPHTKMENSLLMSPMMAVESTLTFSVKKPLKKKVISPTTTISDQDAINLIFHPGFSTKSIVTDVSGRGVGMDVVKHNIESLQGDVLVETKLNEGTTFKIILPLTLAIIDAMVVKVSDSRYVIPLSHVHESVKLEANDIKQTTGLGEILLLRGETIPLFRLCQLMGRKPASSTESQMIALVIRGATESFAVVVDDIIGQYQVVIKQLGPELQNIRGFSGSSILGDGKPALILELAELISKNKSHGTQSLRGMAA